MAEQSGGKAGARTREKQWGGVFTRSAQRVANQLGIIDAGKMQKVKKFRKDELDHLEQYYENKQYEKLPDWIASNDPKDNGYIPVRKRKPLITYPFAKVLCQRIAAKLVGREVFPQFIVEEDPDTQEFIRLILKASQLQARIIEPTRRMLSTGAVLLRFAIIEGQYKIEHFCSKYCYPEFDDANNLKFVRVRYVYDDWEDRDQNGDPKKKWYQLELGPDKDVLYDNPEYKESAQPTFTPVKTAEHGLGFVQAEWLRTAVDKHDPDGPSVYGDLLSFIDEMNYNISQSAQAILYNQDPQLYVKGLSTEEIDELIRSSAKAWNMGKEGDGGFLESNLGAVQVASEFRDKLRLGIQDVARVALLDPDKMVTSAQSGKAMEVLHGPMVEYINELRPEFEERLSAFVLKMLFATLKFASEGFEMAIGIPEDYVPENTNITVQWPAIFPLTIEDLQKKVAVANSLTSASIFSREWAARWLAKDFGVEDVEGELAKVAAQPVINPFGGF